MNLHIILESWSLIVLKTIYLPIEPRKKMMVNVYREHQFLFRGHSVKYDTVKFHSVPGRQDLSLFFLLLIRSSFISKTFILV